MNAYTLHEYRRLRARDWPASDALRAAKVLDAFTDAEAEGLVKLDTVPEISYFDDSYLDCQDLRPSEVTRERKELRERIDREGHWIFVGYARTSEDDDWTPIDSIGGFIGDDFKDSGYDVDVRDACLDWLDAQYQAAAEKMAERATYAAGGEA